MENLEQSLTVFKQQLSETNWRIDCEIHGKEVECRSNQTCVQCNLEKEAAQIAKAKDARLSAAKEKSGVSKRFSQANFDNYTADLPKQQELLAVMKAYKLESNIILFGKTGCGKTHLASALIDKFLKQDKRCYYIKFYQLAKIQIQDKNLFAYIMNTDFLAIDEYGISDSDYKSSLLFELIDQRYDDMKPTMIIGNVTIEEFKKSISDALYSRLKENCIAFNCNWADFRLSDIKTTA